MATFLDNLSRTNDQRCCFAGFSTPHFLAAVALLAILATSLCAADTKPELTLAEFRALVQQQNPSEVDRAGDTFLQLMAAQGREAAARQSLDRLSGWRKAVQARIQAQSAPAADGDLLRLAEARAAVRVAQFNAESLEAQQKANSLLKRSPSSALIAAFPGAPGAAPETATEKPDKKAESVPAPPAASNAPAEVGPEIASRRAEFENVLLPLGSELLSKTYQSYFFGGIPLTQLLLQEQEVYRTEVDYRELLVETARQAAAPPRAQQ